MNEDVKIDNRIDICNVNFFAFLRATGMQGPNSIEFSLPQRILSTHS